MKNSIRVQAADCAALVLPAHSALIALFPGLLTPAFVACSTNAGVLLVTCSDVHGRWVDVWRSGTFFLYSSGTALWTQEMSPRLPDVDCSVAMAVIIRALTYLWFSKNVPLLRTSIQRPWTSLHVHVTCFTRPSPTLVMQAKTLG